MPTQNKVKKLRSAFVPKPNADEVISSAIKIAKSIVNIDVVEQHKKKILSEVQWLITKAHGKYTTKHRTAGAISDGDEPIQHEHVFPRKKVSLRILNDPTNIELYLKNVIGCVVTKVEHDQLSKIEKLNPELDGWDRYEAAGITVYDMETIPPTVTVNSKGVMI